jgi:hypothetical protein
MVVGGKTRDKTDMIIGVVQDKEHGCWSNARDRTLLWERQDLEGIQETDIIVRGKQETEHCCRRKT